MRTLRILVLTIGLFATYIGAWKTRVTNLTQYTGEVIIDDVGFAGGRFEIGPEEVDGNRDKLGIADNTVTVNTLGNKVQNIIFEVDRYYNKKLNEFVETPDITKKSPDHIYYGKDNDVVIFINPEGQLVMKQRDRLKEDEKENGEKKKQQQKNS